ncbi:DUF302 domain-containing protein [Roseivivax sp.]
MTRFARPVAALSCLLLGAAPALADEHVVQKESPHSVAVTIDKLETAVKNAGATIFARVDHAGGAERVEMELSESELLIFGNPKIGTPAMQDDPLAGLQLPLKVLAYEDAEGQVQLAYETPAAMFEGYGVAPEAGYLDQMAGALEKLTGAATSE